MNKEIESQIPDYIKEKFDRVHNEISSCLKVAESFFENPRLQVSLSFTHNALGDILDDEERYQQVCFITRFQCLPHLENMGVEESDGHYYIANLDFLRHILNEYRMILFNKNDSIFYKKLHSFCYRKLNNNDPCKGLSIRAFDVCNNDKTNEFIQYVSANTKAIDHILSNCELDYLYNGILQHSDSRHTKRYWNDYYSGELNYVFLKNALLVSQTKNLLEVYYKIMGCMTLPVLGSL